MFPRFREQLGTALDLVVEFSTLGEYRLGAGSASGAPSAPADASGARPKPRPARPHALPATRGHRPNQPARPQALPAPFGPNPEPPAGPQGRPANFGLDSRLGGLRSTRPVRPGSAAKEVVDRHIVAGGATGSQPVVTPAARRPLPRAARRPRRPAPVAVEQLCLAV